MSGTLVVLWAVLMVGLPPYVRDRLARISVRHLLRTARPRRRAMTIAIAWAVGWAAVFAAYWGVVGDVASIVVPGGGFLLGIAVYSSPPGRLTGMSTTDMKDALRTHGASDGELRWFPVQPLLVSAGVFVALVLAVTWTVA